MGLVSLDYTKEDTMTATTQIYNIRVESRFLLTQRQIKEKLGIGYKVVSVETEKDSQTPEITTVDNAVISMILTGYRALARATHPDLGGDVEKMMILNKAKREVLDLLKSLQ